jgi:hypothetical protein
VSLALLVAPVQDAPAQPEPPATMPDAPDRPIEPDAAQPPTEEKAETQTGTEGEETKGTTEEPAVARDESSAQNRPMEEEITPELVESVSRGLDYLRSLQNEDGSFGRGRYSRHVAIASLAGIAFLADGHVPGRGEYGEVVSRALQFVLSNSTETGLLAAENSHGPMYGHGFATLFLGEFYGMNPDDAQVRDALTRAVALIVNTQNDEGGWRYNPVPFDADISVTISQIMALRSARNAGIKVPKDTIDRAVEYVRHCQNPDGGFKYMAQAGGSAWPRTAAGVASLFYAGIYDDESITRGLDYLTRNALPGTDNPMAQAHYFYGHYYSVQAMYLAGGTYWATWWPAIRQELLDRQDPNGAWQDNQINSAYSTAMALIILQMPKRYLPIFQK